jgi:hypothetical protein
MPNKRVVGIFPPTLRRTILSLLIAESTSKRHHQPLIPAISSGSIVLFTISKRYFTDHVMPKPQETSNSSVKSAKNQAKKEGIASGKKKAKARKDLTGRDHAGNHHNPLSGKTPNDRHQHGVKVLADQAKRKK